MLNTAKMFFEIPTRVRPVHQIFNYYHNCKDTQPLDGYF